MLEKIGTGAACNEVARASWADGPCLFALLCCGAVLCEREVVSHE